MPAEQTTSPPLAAPAAPAFTRLAPAAPETSGEPSGSAPARTAFATDLADAVTLLRGLPTGRDTVEDAYRSVRDWGARRPWLRAQLVVDEPPGATRVGHDLLLDHPEGGTVALSAEVDDGVPWLVDHSTHWAAANILSVDGVGLSIAAALSTIRALGARDRQLHERLVDHRIILGELADEPPPTTAETQRAADEFRRRRGLVGRAQTLTWLADTGMSEEVFWGHVRTQALVARVRERFAGEPARRHLAEYAEDFALRRAAWVTGPEPDALRALLDGPVTGFAERVTAALLHASGTGTAHPHQTGTAHGTGTGNTHVNPYETGNPHGTRRPAAHDAGGRAPELRIASALTPALPEPLRAVPAGTAVGPVPYDGGHLAGVVYEVVPADPEAPEVLDAARDAAFQAWLDERRRTADIRWFWL